MKLLSIAIPSYNSQEYMSHAIESLLPGGDEVEILVVNDGSKDRTAEIADEYEKKYPGIVRAIHKENGGHGDAVMMGLANATGRYFKVVDSDDWVDEESYPKVLAALRERTTAETEIDLLICDYVYDKVGKTRKHVVRYGNALPEGKEFDWEHMKDLKVGQYILMHSAIYRTQMLRECGLTLPKHTFYVDNLYIYTPLPYVQKMLYLDLPFYHYFIGRDDQSVHEEVMIRRIDQQLKVNRMMVDATDVMSVTPVHRREYMFKYLEVITCISSVMCIISGTEENLKKKEELWNYIREKNLPLYERLRRRPFGIAAHLKGKAGRVIVKAAYKLTTKVFGAN